MIELKLLYWCLLYSVFMDQRCCEWMFGCFDCVHSELAQMLGLYRQATVHVSVASSMYGFLCAGVFEVKVIICLAPHTTLLCLAAAPIACRYEQLSMYHACMHMIHFDAHSNPILVA